jgi:hypothetical protein
MVKSVPRLNTIQKLHRQFGRYKTIRYQLSPMFFDASNQPLIKRFLRGEMRNIAGLKMVGAVRFELTTF